MACLDALLIRLDAAQGRLDARRKAKQAPGQLGLFGPDGSGTGVKCGDGWIARDKDCHKGKGGSAKPAAASDELNTDDPDVRMAFVKAMRDKSIARPDASYTGNSLASALLVLCDKPGLVGANARRMAKFLMDSNVTTVIDGVDPTLLPGAPGRESRVRGDHVEHLITKEALAKLSNNSQDFVQQADVTRSLEAEIASHEMRSAVIKKELRSGSVDADVREKLEQELKERKSKIDVYKERLQTRYRYIASALMGRPQAAGLAHRNGIISMRDEPRTDQKWQARAFDDSKMLFSIERQVENYGKVGFRDTDTLSGRNGGRNESVFTTFMHEVGHMVHFASGDVRGPRAVLPEPLAKQVKEVNPEASIGSNLYSMNDKHFVSNYSVTNHLEMFAESFVAFVAAPYELRRRSPEVYGWVDDTLKKANAQPRVYPLGTAAAQ